MKSEQFEKRISQANTALEKHLQIDSRIANLRLVCMILALALTYWTITNDVGIGQLLLVVLAYAIFIVLVVRHQKLRRKIHQLRGVITISNQYLDRLGDGWHQFEDQGSEWVCYDHPYGMDLDIVGPRSLFQKISVAQTWHGRKRLAQILLEGYQMTDDLPQRQQAVSELVNQLDFCQDIQLTVQDQVASGKKIQPLLAYMVQSNGFTDQMILTKCVGILSWIACLGILTGFVFENYLCLGIGGIVALFLGGSTLLYFGKLQACLVTMREVQGHLEQYGHVMKVIEKQSFYSPYLKKIQDVLGKQEVGAIGALDQLKKICDRSTFTLQPLLAIPLNALWGWDFKCARALEEWRRVHGGQLEEWLEAVGEIESLVSLSVLGQIEECVSIPLIEAGSKCIQVTALGHPLLSQQARVCNDLCMEDELLVVTGSNMSGKTTFLRTVGINLVLAYSGSVVTANQMHTGIFAICTSMRIKDDLQEGVSTFYAELKRIKQMLEIAKQTAHSLCLIDEIFRGTNSKDRILGAQSVLKGLKSTGAIGGITTHDLELCELGTRVGITNYHFTESYEDQTIHFDYKIKEGPSTSTNAQYLMEMVGIKIGEL
ncbi:MAG: MutS-related protein [Cellulosilyticaceae bacterium]